MGSNFGDHDKTTGDGKGGPNVLLSPSDFWAQNYPGALRADDLDRFHADPSSVSHGVRNRVLWHQKWGDTMPSGFNPYPVGPGAQNGGGVTSILNKMGDMMQKGQWGQPIPDEPDLIAAHDPAANEAVANYNRFGWPESALGHGDKGDNPVTQRYRQAHETAGIPAFTGNPKVGNKPSSPADVVGPSAQVAASVETHSSGDHGASLFVEHGNHRRRKHIAR